VQWDLLALLIIMIIIFNQDFLNFKIKTQSKLFESQTKNKNRKFEELLELF